MRPAAGALPDAIDRGAAMGGTSSGRQNESPVSKWEVKRGGVTWCLPFEVCVSSAGSAPFETGFTVVRWKCMRGLRAAAGL